MTKVAAGKKVGSSGEDYKGVVEEVISKKKRLTTTKIQKEAAEWRDYIEAEGKYLYPLLKYYCCLWQHYKNKKYGVVYCLEFELKHYPIQPYYWVRWLEAIEQRKATLNILDLLLLSKIKYSKHLQDRENKKDIKVSLGSYKYY